MTIDKLYLPSAAQCVKVRLFDSLTQSSYLCSEVRLDERLAPFSVIDVTAVKNFEVNNQTHIQEINVMRQPLVNLIHLQQGRLDLLQDLI